MCIRDRDYTDKEFEDKEMWERLDGSVTRVAQINSNFGDETKGKLTLTFKNSAVLTPGNRLIIKLRLPHTEWEGEEVDYLSESVPILDENETIVPAKDVYKRQAGGTAKAGTERRHHSGKGFPWNAF